jgi:hypothetical protein
MDAVATKPTRKPPERAARPRMRRPIERDAVTSTRGGASARVEIQGIAIVTSAIFVLINILVDLAATTIDPRLEY